MTRQKQIFLDGEGDAWFERNRAVSAANDPVISGLSHLQLAPKRVAEIGCGSGARLAAISKTFGAECFGFDPSAKAVEHATQEHPVVSFQVGTADAINLADKSIDLLVFGFCLYLTDPSDHFRIASEADRVLDDGGVAVVLDFLSPAPYRNSYSHFDGVFSHKMEFSRMLAWHPTYRLIHRTYLEHSTNNTFEINEAVAADFIRKDQTNAFPLAREA